MNSNIDTTNGGGPWVIPVEALSPEETAEYRLRSYEYRGQKGYFREWLPLDNLLVRNRDPDNPVSVLVNGQFSAFVGPNSAESFSDAGITSVKVENGGGTEIAEADLKLQLSKEPYDADDAARSEANRHPLEKMARNLVGL